MMKQRRGDLGRAHEFVAHYTFNDGDHIVDRGVHPHIAVNAGGRARQHLAFDLAYAHRDNPQTPERLPQGVNHRGDFKLDRIEQRNICGSRSKRLHRFVQHAGADDFQIRAARKLNG